MSKKILGYLLLLIGFGGMALAAYLFVTGSGARLNLVEVTVYMIVGAFSFFTGLNYIYEASRAFSESNLQDGPELKGVSPIQQQWRTIQIKTDTPVEKSKKLTSTNYSV